MTDYLSCGSCPLEFELREFADFVEHKLTSCQVSNTTNILECLQCFKQFHTSMPLLLHLQRDHRLSIVKMYALPRPTASKSTILPSAAPVLALAPSLSSTSTHRQPTVLTSVPSVNSLPPKLGEFTCCQTTNAKSSSSKSSSDAHCCPLPLTCCIKTEVMDDGSISCACETVLQAPVAVKCCTCTSKTTIPGPAVALVDSQVQTDWHFPSSPDMQADDMDEEEDFFIHDHDLSEVLDQLTGQSTSMENIQPPDYSAAGNGSYAVHNHHLAATAVASTSEPYPSTASGSRIVVGRFACDQCGLHFRQKIHLRKHLMSHHGGIKPHKCPQCNYATVEKSHLTVHLRKHTGEKPFHCRDCDYASAQNCTLKNHYFRKHPDSRTLCELCGKQFVTDFERENHTRGCSIDALNDTGT